MKNSSSVVAFVLLITFGVVGCSNESLSQTGTVQNVNQDAFVKLAAQKDAVIVDVRTPGEVAAGYIKGATVFADINGADFTSQIAKLDKSKAYLVYCRSGARSSAAADYLTKQGFKKVYNLVGGISNWKGDIIVK